MTHDISTIYAQIDSLLARGAAAVNIVVNIDRTTGEARWGEVTAMESGEMSRALSYAYGDEYRENGTDPADEVAEMLDADEYRSRYPLDEQ